jgi:hypothetical protein
MMLEEEEAEAGQPKWTSQEVLLGKWDEIWNEEERNRVKMYEMQEKFKINRLKRSDHIKQIKMTDYQNKQLNWSQ